METMNRFNMPEKLQIFDGCVLKIIACIAMLLDHAANCLIYQNLYLRGNFFYYWSGTLESLHTVYMVLYIIGRAAFPIFAFLLVEGFIHTQSRLKYALRLLILAIISEIPFNLCLYNSLLEPYHNNTCFTLLIGLLVLWTWEKFKDNWYIRLPICSLLFIAARQLNFDYRWRGVLLIFIFYLLRTWRIPQVIAGLISMYWEFPGAILGFVPLLLYNGKRGRQMRYLFYAFYPAHLFILYLISRFVLKGG